MRRIGWLAVGVFAIAWAGTATAATPLDKCLGGRAKAQGKYEQCVEKWLSKVYGTNYTFFDPAKLAKCRIKYAKAWDKLAALATAPCSGNRYADNGDGTVTDNLTGLMWEKKSDNGDIHDQDTTRTWSTGSPYKGNGQAYDAFLTTGLNVAGFAGAKDWRLPTFAELGTILLPEDYPCATNPCVPAAFNTSCTAGCASTACSCTRSYYYWSATTGAGYSDYAWILYFNGGGASNGLKTSYYYVRAVRGGL